MSDILSAVLAGAPAEELAGLPLPATYRAALVRRADTGIFDGMESSQKDPRKSLHVEETRIDGNSVEKAVTESMSAQ